MIPPVNEIKNGITLKRYPREQHCVMGLENGDTYSVTHEELAFILKRLGVPEDLGVVDYLWNFYAVYVDLNYMVMKSLSIEQAETMTGRKEPVIF